MGAETVLPLRFAQPQPVPQSLGPNPTQEQLTDAIRSLTDYANKQRAALDRMYSLLTQIISERHGAGPLANRPLPGVLCRLYLVTDNLPDPVLQVDTGTVWLDVGP